jgi:hypothetical protein
MSDQTVWAGSFLRGVAQLGPDGQVLRTLTSELADGRGYVASVAGDPLDESIWVGTAMGGGLSRVRGSRVEWYGSGMLPHGVLHLRVPDIQVDRWSGVRRILVAFQGDESTPGAIGIYSGP